MRRGAVAESTLILLGEGDMVGYEIMAELESRSQGRWRPSPGSVYPALSRLESKGLIVGVDTEGEKRRYALTEEGQAWLARRDPDAPVPWEEEDGPRRGGDLRATMSEIGGTVRQIGRFGSDAQRAAALKALQETRQTMYTILAEGAKADAEGTDES